jgi:hypothetical protein
MKIISENEDGSFETELTTEECDELIALYLRHNDEPAGSISEMIDWSINRVLEKYIDEKIIEGVQGDDK